MIPEKIELSAHIEEQLRAIEQPARTTAEVKHSSSEQIDLFTPEGSLLVGALGVLAIGFFVAAHRNKHPR